MPDKLLSHGWILNAGEKMSKSLGNVINPLDYIDQYGADGLRFYIANELPINKDGSFSQEMFIEAYNAHLANNVGNLISRVNNMITKYFDGYLGSDITTSDQVIDQAINQVVDDYQNLMNQYDIYGATRKVLEFANLCNKYIEEKAPWILAKENQQAALKTVLIGLQKAITVISYLLKPILVFTYEDMLEQCGVETPSAINYDELKTFTTLKFKKLGAKKVLFNRIRTES